MAKVKMVCEKVGKGMLCHPAGAKIKSAPRKRGRKTTKSKKRKTRRSKSRVTHSGLEFCAKSIKGVGTKIKCFKKKSDARKLIRRSSVKYPFKTGMPCRNKAGHKVYCVYGKKTTYSRFTPHAKRKRKSKYAAPQWTGSMPPY